MLNSFPHGCGGDVNSEDYVECTRGKDYKQTSMIFGGIIGVIIFILLGSITWHVYSIEKTLVSSGAVQEKEQSEELQSNTTPKTNEDFQEDHDGAANKETTPKKRKSLTRNAIQQSLLYIIAFIITYAAPFISVSRVKVMDSHIGIFILWLNSMIFPIFGIFLILIYTRPKVQILQQKFPKASWWLCFTVVLGSGGDVPPAHELEPSGLPIMSGEDLGMGSHHALSMSGVDDEDVSYEDMKSSMISLCQDDAWSHVSSSGGFSDE
ncbi:predicted protein [Chaetoceros tenuissimus]|uniref:Uncharacterized protein n=1 Tax=Chaetoceros tenuissimus TaxID=426638 RepID=A0AAD3H9G5_9STRA|nr:predicted protein [Chaetoceros tenuissimus]